MPFRRSRARLSSNALTARSMGTSPQTTSRILRPELPKNSPTVLLNAAPACSPRGILTKMNPALEAAALADGVIWGPREGRSRHTRRRGRGPARGVRDPQAAAGVGRGGCLRLGQRPRARRLERAHPYLHLSLRRAPRLPRQLGGPEREDLHDGGRRDRKSTRLNSSHANISYAVFCLKKKKKTYTLYLIYLFTY